MAATAPEAALTVELRRDLVADWDPFVELHVDPIRARRAAAALARALLSRPLATSAAPVAPAAPGAVDGANP